MNAMPIAAKTIFLNALEIPSASERQAYVEAECASDLSLRREVEQLLAHFDAQKSFLETPISAAATTDMPAVEQLGTMIGPYKLLEQIGEGGFGVVYLAEQTEPVRRKVALKILKPGMDTRQIVARFEAERQALAIMDHPNIAKVFDGGSTAFGSPLSALGQNSNEGAHEAESRWPTADGRPYFVMELVKGIPITDYCDQNHLTPRQRLELFIPVCQAVQHAHQKGIIHRDLKPSNVLVTRHDSSPVPKVIDFGVAKAVAGVSDPGAGVSDPGYKLTEKTLFTAIAQMIGTPLYMSPEQAGMSDLDIDTRSDIYSLGVLLYELLTGTTPLDKKRFKNSAYDEIRRIIREEEPPKPSTRLSALSNRVAPQRASASRSDATTSLASVAALRQTEPAKLTKLIKGELDWIVMKCLEKDRSRRYETASALAADVRRYLNDEPVQACPPSASYRFRKFARRNRRALVPATVLALAALVGAGALAASTGLVWSANKDLSESLDRERHAVNQERSEAYIQRITVAHYELFTDLAAALHALRECPKDLRGWEWHYLMRRCRVEPLVIKDKTQVLGVAFSPDGEQLASAGGDGFVRIWTSRTGKLLREFPAHGKAACGVVFHPQGRYLASTGADGMVRVWDLSAEPAVKVFEGPCDALRKFGAAYTVAFSPSDGRLLAAGSKTVVRVWDWKKNQPEDPEHAFTGHKNHSIPLAFSHDGRQLATGGAWQGQRVWDLETRRLLRTFPAHQHPMSALAFSPNGGQLAAASLERRVSVWNTTTGELVRDLVHTGNVLGVAFSPDGTRLVSTSEDKTVRVWDTTTFREVLVLHGHTDSCGCVAFSPDSQRLVSASLDGTIRVWDATPLRGNEGEDNTFARYGDELRCVAVSPDGKTIVSAGHGGFVKVWDAATGQMIVEIPGHTVLVWSVAWHPDGGRIATAGSDGGSQLAVKVWDGRDGQKRLSISAGGENSTVPFTVVTFSPGPQGRYLVTGKQDGKVEVWDANTGKPIRTLGTHDREIRGVVFSPDNEHLATASGDGEIKLWDARRLDKEQQPRLPPLRARVPGPCLNVAFSPDSQRLVTGGKDNTVKIWDVRTGRELHTLRGHTGDVYTVAFSPNDNGRWIASGGEDSTVKIWDSRTGDEVLTLRGHTGLVSTLAFSPDGKRLYSGSRDTTVKVWDMTKLHELGGR